MCAASFEFIVIACITHPQYFYYVQFLLTGREFNNRVVDKLFTLSGCHHCVMSSYHPQVNGTLFKLSIMLKIFLIIHATQQCAPSIKV